jgi:hypothetical protein
MTIDADAVRRAVSRLGLKRRVSVTWVTGPKHMVDGRVIPVTHNGVTRRGEHLRSKSGNHVITLLASLADDTRTMSETLAHELVHARQSEDHGKDWAAAYRAETEANGYEANRFEREAKRVGRELAEDLRLVR